MPQTRTERLRSVAYSASLMGFVLGGFAGVGSFMIAEFLLDPRTDAAPLQRFEYLAATAVACAVIGAVWSGGSTWRSIDSGRRDSPASANYPRPAADPAWTTRPLSTARRDDEPTD